MKKGAIGTAVVLALGIGAGGGYFFAKEEPKQEVTHQKEDSAQNKEKTKTEVSDVSTTPKEKEQEKPTPPTKRTVDIGNKKPWEVYTTTDLLNKQRKEQLFLFSDAEALENEVLHQHQIQGKKLIEFYAIIQVFIAQLKDYYPEKQAYFEKMAEAGQAIFDKEYDKIPSLIQEAKQLREREAQ